ncbi:MAG: hypothetical protein V4702_02205 [Patescibacteria group bacterium]
MIRYKTSQFSWFIAVLILGLVPLVRVLEADAATLQNRSIRAESSQVNANTIHVFNYNIPSISVVGSTVFEYCANDPLLQTPCTPPLGLDVSVSNLDSEAGDVGYSIHASTTSNRLILTRLPVLSIPGAAQYVFSNIINPSSIGTVYVRISLHASVDGTGPYGDGGGVVFSIANQLSTQAFVPPFLIFCVGVTVANDCSSSTGSNIDFGELSRTSPKTATSQFAGATNDATGFFTNIVANTMTSGNQVINPLIVPTNNAPGTSQFGLNMRANSNPSVGQDPVGIGSSTIQPDYAIPNQFILKDGVVTSSPLPTDFNAFTVSYLVNVAANQAPGVYNTTLTYVATAAF